MQKTNLELLQLINTPLDMVNPEDPDKPFRYNLLQRLKTSKGLPMSVVWRLGTLGDEATRALGVFQEKRAELEKQRDALLAELKPVEESEEGKEGKESNPEEETATPKKSRGRKPKTDVPTTEPEIEARRQEINAEYEKDFSDLLTAKVELSNVKLLSAAVLFGNPEDPDKYPGATDEAAALLTYHGVVEWLKPWMIDDIPESLPLTKGKSR
jgi:hypothetical protein